MTDYPLQTGANCVAYSYWVAMRIALKQADPYRKFTVTPSEIEKLIGAPCPVTGETVEELENRYGTSGDFYFDTLPFGEDGMPPKTLPMEFPIVVSNWQYGYSHAFCLLPEPPAPTSELIPIRTAYDPGRGAVVLAQLDKCAGHTTVKCGAPEDFPYARWYWRFTFIRKLIKP